MTTCTICNHPEREAINRLLSLPSPNLSQIAKTFSVHRTSVHRHRTTHVPGGIPEREALPEARNNEPFPADPAPIDTPAHSISELRPILEMVRTAQPSQVVKRSRQPAAPAGGLPTFYQEALTDIQKL